MAVMTVEDRVPRAADDQIEAHPGGARAEVGLCLRLVKMNVRVLAVMARNCGHLVWCMTRRETASRLGYPVGATEDDSLAQHPAAATKSVSAILSQKRYSNIEVDVATGVAQSLAVIGACTRKRRIS